MTNYDSANFDAANSSEIIAEGIRRIKKRLLERYEKTKAWKNPKDLPKDKELKAINDDAALKKLLDAVVAHWQEEAFTMGYRQALAEINSDIQRAGI